MKYVVVTGGVISGIGKGVIASSTGLLLKTLGLKVTSIKVDPYMNIDAGTMSPLEHGEVFVLNDGGEVDLDLGNYERYLNVTLTRDNNITTGKIYSQVIERERKGDYLGKTVQVVPHITNAIQDWIERVARIPVDDSDEEPDVCIIELGGTVGDIESAPFIEALRQFQFRAGKNNFALIHVSLVPTISGEQKTKPTQAAIRDLRSLGLTPDMIACRCSEKLEKSIVEKISMFCHVGTNQVLIVNDLRSIYHVPILLKEQKMLKNLEECLNLKDIIVSRQFQSKGTRLWSRWVSLTQSHNNMFEKVTIALVGKYTHLQDAYISVIKSLEHAAMRLNRNLVISWVEASDLESDSVNSNSAEKMKFHTAWQQVCSADGILVPGGFGVRGIEGMIAAAKWARENNIPYLGICLGLQIAVIEFMRHVLNVPGATSEEFNPDVTPENKAILFMPEISKTHLGGTMRLGLRPTIFQKGTEKWSKIRRLYDNSRKPSRPSTSTGLTPSDDEASEDINLDISDENKTTEQKNVSSPSATFPDNSLTNKFSGVIYERHRHRYEVNPEFIKDFEQKGLKFVGKDEAGQRMEIIEIEKHPYFVGTQYHPEYLSRVLEPSKPFLGLIAAASGQLDDFLDRVGSGMETPVAEAAF